MLYICATKLISMKENDFFNDEALEQGASEYSKIWETQIEKNVSFMSFINGGKFQEKKMYSEEEVYQLLIILVKWEKEIREVADVKVWFEQFKKK